MEYDPAFPTDESHDVSRIPMPSMSKMRGGSMHMDLTTNIRGANIHMMDIPMPSEMPEMDIPLPPDPVKFNLKNSAKNALDSSKRVKSNLTTGLIPKTNSGPTLFMPSRRDIEEFVPTSTANKTSKESLLGSKFTSEPPAAAMAKPTTYPTPNASSPPFTNAAQQPAVNNSLNNNNASRNFNSNFAIGLSTSTGIPANVNPATYTKILRPDQALLTPSLQHLNPQKLRSAQMIAMPLICRQTDTKPAVPSSNSRKRSASSSSNSSYSSSSSSSSPSRSRSNSNRGRYTRRGRRSPSRDRYRRYRRSPMISSRRGRSRSSSDSNNQRKSRRRSSSSPNSRRRRSRSRGDDSQSRRRSKSKDADKRKSSSSKSKNKEEPHRPSNGDSKTASFEG